MRISPLANTHSADADRTALSLGLRLSNDEVTHLLREVYGLDVAVSSLDGDRDANYRVVASTGAVMMFKVIHPDEHAETTRTQDALLTGLADVAPHLPVPRIVRALDGSASPMASTEQGCAFATRLVSFLDGVPIGSMTEGVWDPDGFGVSIGELMNAMAELPPTKAAPLVWDLMQPRLALALAPSGAPQPGDSLAVSVLERFAPSAPEAFADLPWQPLHNDLNPGNVLVKAETGRTSAFIDFGDSVHGPRIGEVAVALSYLIDPDQEAERWDAVSTLRGIHRSCPLEPQEIDVLFELIAVRLAVTILVAHWRAARFPSNSEYITRNTDAAVRRLTALMAARGTVTTRLFRAVTVEAGARL